jgi:hypothetical protein
MNIFMSQQQITARFIAAVSIVALLLSAFPASFFVAEATSDATDPVEARVGSLVEDTEEGDLCDNMLGVQLVIPDGYVADGSGCYPVIPDPVETIKVCKYVYDYDDERSYPVSGWTIYLTNIGQEESSEGGTEFTLVTEGEEGCVSQAVNPEEGPWFAYEEMQEGWSQNSVGVTSGVLLGERYVAEYCQFFGEAISDDELSSAGRVASPRCDFYNDDDREEVTGFKWNDSNNNGIKDEAEVGIADWTITATDESDYGYESVVTTTEADGSYSLLLPWQGEWTITEETRLNWTQTNVIMDGELLNTIDSEEPYTSCTFGWYEAEEGSSEESSASSCEFLNHFTAPVIAEEPPRRSSGGGSGTRVKDRAPQGVVLGAATSTQQCGMYLNDYMRQGKATSSTEVTKLQIFLNAVGIKLEVTGDFDTATDAAVRGFQAQHKAEVLTPWYLAKIVPHENPTGWVYQLTRWKINNIVCPGSEAYPVLN